MAKSRDGILVIDKPRGLSSYRVVERVKKIVGADKAGHTGTLDPFATGVLPVCLNQATKAARFFLEEDKEYQATMLLGVETDTMDLLGKVTRRCATEAVREEDLHDTARALVGRIEQRPPAYSAVKVGGRPLYKAARQGEKVEAPPRTVTIYRLEVLGVKGPYVSFRVHCSKGAYIRVLAADWGRMLGCGAHLTELRRLRSGPFTLEQALTLEELEQAASQERVGKRVIDLNRALSHWPELKVDESTARRVRQGGQLYDVASLAPLNLKRDHKVRLVGEDHALVAIMNPVFDARNHQVRALKPLRVFNP